MFAVRIHFELNPSETNLARLMRLRSCDSEASLSPRLSWLDWRLGWRQELSQGRSSSAVQSVSQASRERRGGD